MQWLFSIYIYIGSFLFQGVKKNRRDTLINEEKNEREKEKTKKKKQKNKAKAKAKLFKLYQYNI